MRDAIVDNAIIHVADPLRDKAEALRLLADLFAARYSLSSRSRDSVLDHLHSRDQTRSTGIGQGFAQPHAKLTVPEFAGIMVAWVFLREPLDFGSIDRVPVSVIASDICPPDRTSIHIQCLARLSRMMTRVAADQRAGPVGMRTLADYMISLPDDGAIRRALSELYDGSWSAWHPPGDG